MLFLNAAPQHPTRRALVHAETGRAWTYGQLEQTAARVARRLSGTPKGVIAWIARSVPASVAAYLGALASGHAVLPVPANLSDELLMRMLEAYQPEMLLTVAEDTLPASLTAAYCRGDAGDDGAGDDDPVVWRRRAETSGDVHPDVCLLLSTSGSTGSPKMVRLTARNLLSNAEGIVEALQIDQHERAITSLPLFYSFGLSVLHSHLLAGAELVLTERSVLEAQFWDAVEQYACSSLAGVPYTYGMLRRVGLEQRAPGSLRTLLQAGGKMSDDLILHFHELMASRGGRLFVMYGQTEATARISVLPAHLLPTKLGGVGFPLRGGSLEVRSSDGGRATRAAPGEIIYRGPNVMLGYAEQRSDLERGDDLQEVLQTGDLGYVDLDGCLFVTGRSKRIAKVFGLRINLDDLEARLAAVGPVALVGEEDAISIFVPEGRAEVVRPAVTAVASQLKIHPSGFRLNMVKDLPLLPNGKVDYNRLREYVAGADDRRVRE